LKKPIPFGKYYLLERINVGGMAEVFKAKTFGVEGFERIVAVKRILPNIAEDEEFITMFIDEAKIAVQLQHANIAQIFELGTFEDAYFIALEYVRGRDMRAIFDRLRQRGEILPLPQACYIIMQVCEGLDYAHNKRDSQGQELHLVHRDISPQNVLVGYEGEVKLIDFGIAKAAGKAGKTQAGILKGKFGYMSPEQVRGLPIDRRSDIFSVGICLYELLTNERLFVGESDFSTLEKVRNVEILPPSSYNRAIPPELEQIVLKALARDPEDRYQNAIDLHDDLQQFLYKFGIIGSRKDLAAWMKKSFPAEIEEENAKMEQFRQIAAPPPPPSGSSSGGRSGGGATYGSGTASGGSELTWDDEELDTQIYDKDPAAMAEEHDAFQDDDDRTVTNAPPPDVLRAATSPDLRTPAPSARPKPDAFASVPPRRSAPSAPGLTGSAFSGATSLSGGGGLGPERTPVTPPPDVPLPALPPPTFSSPSQRLPPVTASALNLGSPSQRLPRVGAPPEAPAILGDSGPVLGAPNGWNSGRISSSILPQVAPPPGSPFAPLPMGPGLGPNTHVGPAPRGGRRAMYGVLGLLVAVIAAVGGYFYWSQNRTGRFEISVVPPDATVLIDNVKVGDRSPVVVERPAGTYTLSVTKDGWVRASQNLELRAGQIEPVPVTLDPSPDTGFELTSEPPGGLVWLDDKPILSGTGQARTDFRAYRIPPGRHVLEIKGNPKLKPWRQEVDILPSQINKFHAKLEAASGGDAAAGAASAKPGGDKGGDKAGSEKVAERERGSDEGAKSAGGTPVTPPAIVPSGSSTPQGPTSSNTQTRRRRARESSQDDSASSGSSETSGAGSASAPTGDCNVIIGARPWAEVWIDGRSTGRHTPYSDKIGCGRHKISLRRPDLDVEQNEVIVVRPGELFKKAFTLPVEE
jgi:serine/threonine protein kinase